MHHYLQKIKEREPHRLYFFLQLLHSPGDVLLQSCLGSPGPALRKLNPEPGEPGWAFSLNSWAAETVSFSLLVTAL